MARGDYQWSLIIQAGVFALTVSALTIAAWSSLTPAVALIIWVGAFRVGQGFLGSYLSESVGYSCACLSLAYLLVGCKENRFGVRVAGIEQDKQRLVGQLDALQTTATQAQNDRADASVNALVELLGGTPLARADVCD